jgi:hypothetical protein
MEALLAILLMASFSVVTGYYFSSLSHTYVQNKRYMHAIDCAAAIAYQICLGKTYEVPAKPFTLKVEHTSNIVPRVIAGPPLSLAPLELTTIAIAWKGLSSWQEIKLATIAGVS